ncbi:hypothetical protein CAL28_16470 [Bordetella genomosp. 11]|uniref:Uncharacterized protein n=1 Tax=Bordetella genomosp. 11 TaxID=1416808 RepID=A0A261UJA5_9BORD|nr:hypothetical protein CAL28_16470 [Bordetella genomosp. 11]
MTYSLAVSVYSPSSEASTLHRHRPFASTVTGPLVHSDASRISEDCGTVCDEPSSEMSSVDSGWPSPCTGTIPSCRTDPSAGRLTVTGDAISNVR